MSLSILYSTQILSIKMFINLSFMSSTNISFEDCDLHIYSHRCSMELLQVLCILVNYRFVHVLDVGSEINSYNLYLNNQLFC